MCVAWGKRHLQRPGLEESQLSIVYVVGDKVALILGNPPYFNARLVLFRYRGS